MKTLKNNLKTLSIAISLALPASYIGAKTLDPNLLSVIQQAPASELHQVIISFDGEGAASSEQLNAIKALGIDTGVSMQSLPIVGALATSEQINALYARDDVISVWQNAPVELENFESTQITGVKQMRKDLNLRKNGLPISGRGIGVVVNDSGVDGTHSDLAFPSHVVQNVLAQTNLRSFSDLLPITYRENVSNTDIGGGHGTHVAGTVGGNGAMSSGIHAGVAPGADIIGYGSGAGLFILDTIGGFDYALTHQAEYGIRVISNSFGSTGDTGTDFNPDDPTNIATKSLADSGIITVFSAGNSGPGEGTITGNFKKAPWVITVAAGDKNGNLADFSSRGVPNASANTVVVDGETFTWEDRPTITAPGVDVISARASTSSLGGLSAQDDIDMIEPGNLAYYTVSSGTSMAAPHVSGIVALILEANPSLQWQEVKELIQETATPMTGRSKWEVGAGYINAHAAVTAAIEGTATFGDTVKLNRTFNATVNTEIADEFTLQTEFTPVGEPSVVLFEVASDISMVSASATIETGSAFVLEDPNGNTYSSGIGLIQLGSRVGVSAPGVAGQWKLYSGGIGSVSGLAVDPAGVTNGVGVPSTTDVNFRLIRTTGIEGIDDSVDHPAQAFIEYVVQNQVMDATQNGFKPDRLINKEELADTLTLAASMRQTTDGNTIQFNDSTAGFSAAINSVSGAGNLLSDLTFSNDPLMLSDGSSTFGAKDKVTKEALAYSLVQSLGLQEEAQSFDVSQPVTTVFLGETIEIEDSQDIVSEFKGYVQLAISLNLMQVNFTVEQGPFDLEPSISATFAPKQKVTRAETAYSVTQLNSGK